MNYLSLISYGITAMSALFGAVFGCYQFRKHVKSKRASFVSQLTKEINKYRDIVRLFEYYGTPWYVENRFVNDTIENGMDSYLTFIEKILYLEENHILDDKESDLFAYYINRLKDDECLKKYLIFLDNYVLSSHSPLFPFPRLKKLCIGK